MGQTTVIDFTTNDTISLWCTDCPGGSLEGDLSDGGNNLTRSQAMYRLRKHFNQTGHVHYHTTAIGEVRIPERWVQ